MVQGSVVVVCVDLATSISAVILLLFASRSCRRLQVGLLVAGDKTHRNLHGFVVTNRKWCAHEIAFSSFMFPNHGARMSFAARVQKSHMLFAPL